MIRKAFIAPKKFVGISNQGDFHLVLAQDLEDAEYINSLKGKIIFLDNGAHEGQFKGVDWYLGQIDKVEPKVVFAPDDITSGINTMRLTQEFIDRVLVKYNGAPPFLIAAIPHGEDIYEYLKWNHEFLKDNMISIIGVSYLDPAKFYPKDPMCIARRILLQRLNISILKKPVHLLGGSDGFSDIMYARTLDWVHTWDTSSPFMHGVQRKKYDGLFITGGKPSTLDPKITELDDEQLQCIQYNIDFIKNDFKSKDGSGEGMGQGLGDGGSAERD